MGCSSKRYFSPASDKDVSILALPLVRLHLPQQADDGGRVRGKMLLHGPVLQLPEPDFHRSLLGLGGKKDSGSGREEAHWLRGGEAGQRGPGSACTKSLPAACW